jgi:CheY-like chemotaxis protein
MPEGGELWLRTREVELDGHATRGHASLAAGRYVVLSVCDDGVGMDEEVLSHLFEPFFTTKEKGRGTGLGLATVYGIVSQSGGDIVVDSTPGKGSTFSIYLPRLPEETEQVEEAPAERRRSAGAETVLLVEDEAGVRELASRVLRGQGYTVLEASDGPRALELFADHRGEIRMLVTDVVMPHMSGRILAQRLLEQSPGVGVLYISGYTDDAILHHGVLGPDSTFLQKPFAPEALAQKVREVLDRARPPGR